MAFVSAMRKEPRERDPAYMGWVAHLPCVACMYAGKYNTAVQVAHLRASSLEHDKRETGKGEKPHDRWTLPLCMPHHTGDSRVVRVSQHGMDEIGFWESFGIDPFGLCLSLNAAYKAGQSGSAVISLAAATGRRLREGADQ